MLLDAQAVIVVLHPFLRLPETLEHRARARREQRARPCYVAITGKIDVGIKTLTIKFKNWFQRRKIAADRVESVAWHQMGVTIDYHSGLHAASTPLAYKAAVIISQE